jgi:hypothetical protein
MLLNKLCTPARTQLHVHFIKFILAMHRRALFQKWSWDTATVQISGQIISLAVQVCRRFLEDPATTYGHCGCIARVLQISDDGGTSIIQGASSE